MTMPVERVGDYPRPPRLEPVAERIRIVLGGETIADTSAALRVLETTHPPTYYLPPSAFLPGALVPAPGGDHFTIVEELRRPDGLLVRTAIEALG